MSFQVPEAEQVMSFPVPREAPPTGRRCRWCRGKRAPGWCSLDRTREGTPVPPRVRGARVLGRFVARCAARAIAMSGRVSDGRPLADPVRVFPLPSCYFLRFSFLSRRFAGLFDAASRGSFFLVNWTDGGPR